MAKKTPAAPKAEMVADRIREVREELGLNQSDFAQKIGVSRSYLSDVENYRVKMTLDFIFSVADNFRGDNKKAEFLTLLTGKNQPVPWGENPNLSPLNVVLGLDGRAMEAVFKSLNAIEEKEGKQISEGTKARYFRQALYIYMSELMRACNSGIEVDEARLLAKHACESIDRDLSLPEG